MRTSAAHLAVRAMLHPVLARPVVHRGSLPLRALLGQLLSQCIFVIDIADIWNVYPDFRPPNRRRHPPAREVGPRSDSSLPFSEPKNNGVELGWIGSLAVQCSASGARGLNFDLNACPVKSIPDRRVFIGRFVGSTNETLQFLHEFIPGSHQSKMRSLSSPNLPSSCEHRASAP